MPLIPLFFSDKAYPLEATESYVLLTPDCERDVSPRGYTHLPCHPLLTDTGVSDVTPVSVLTNLTFPSRLEGTQVSYCECSGISHQPQDLPLSGTKVKRRQRSGISHQPHDPLSRRHKCERREPPGRAHQPHFP